MADMVTEVGNKPVNHGAANTLPFDEAVRYVRGAGAAVTRDWAGGWGSDSSTTDNCERFIYIFI